MFGKANIGRASAALSGCLIALVASLSAPAQAASPAVVPQVVGGADVSVADVPWQVLFLMNDETVCGGALVSPTHVLSAAHCFTNYPLQQIRAWAGISRMEDRSDTSELAIASITPHPDYNPSTFANDIALIKLSSPVPGELGALTIGLPSRVDAAAWPAAGSTALVSGWGETDPTSPVASNQLQAASVKILASPGATTCGSYGGAYLGSLQICAGQETGGVDACEGDSGGPLTMFIDGEPVLAGLSSTGVECGAADYPGLYVRMTSYLPWLASLGVDINREGATSTLTTPGSDRDGVPANFRVGETYAKRVFSDYAALSPTKSRLKVVGGQACSQVKQAVRIDGPGKCRITMSQGRKSVPLIITVYSS